jgi:hypothetical protein
MNFICDCGYHFNRSITDIKKPDAYDGDGNSIYEGEQHLILSCPKCNGKVRHIWNLENIIIFSPKN